MRRAVGSVRAQPLTPREEAEVAGLLGERLAGLFWQQEPMDQRHGIDAARLVLARRPGSHQLARAALLHDIGKRHATLGVPGRIAATLLAIARVPVRGRMRVYLEHAERGARELEAAGADPITVAYARHQDGLRPDAIEPGAWALLKQADGEKHRVVHAAQYDGG